MVQNHGEESFANMLLLQDTSKEENTQWCYKQRKLYIMLLFSGVRK